MERQAVERAKTTGELVVVDALSTETQTVTARPDGRLQVALTVSPTRVKQGDSWVPIDTDLAAGDDGFLSPNAAAVPVRFSAGGSGPMARVQGSDGTWVDLSSPFGAALPAPIVEGNTATYPEVLPGVDLHLSATPIGLTQVLEIGTAEAAKNPALDQITIPIQTGAATAAGRTGGVGQVRGKDGAVVLTVGAAHWWDSSAADASVDGPGDAPAGRTVSSSLGAGALTVDVDAAADTPGVKFPVFVDPAWQSPRWNWAYVDSAYPTTSYYNGGSSDGVARVGYINAALAYDDNRDHTTRSIFSFGLSGIAGKQVSEAHMDVVNIHSSSCTATSTSLYISGPLATDTTWNNQPSTLSGALDTKSFAHRNDAACPVATEGFNATVAVQTAQANGWSDLTLKLQADNESSYLSWKKFESNPALTMLYNSVPNAVSGLGVSGCALTCSPIPYTRSGTPTFTATPSDPDGENLTVDFEVRQGSTVVKSGTSATVASGVQASKAVGPLADGAYTFRARAKDASAAYGPWSGDTAFVVDTVLPAAPTVSAVISAAPVTPDDGPVIGETAWTVTITGNANDRAKGYAYAAALAGVVTAPPGNLTCDQRSSYYVVVCPATIGAAVTATVAAPAENSTVTAWTFDAAGNVNASSSKWGPAASVDLKVVQTAPAPTLYPAASPRVPWGHLWDSADLPVDGSGNPTQACASHTVPDATMPSVTPRPLTLTATGACWINDAARSNPVLTFNGTTGGGVADRDPAVDTANSFSVGAWVYPTSTTGIRTFLGQYSSAAGASSAYRSVYYLQVSSGQWRFCVALTTAAGSGTDCAVINGATANQWTFVTGGYDKTNQRIWIRTSTATSLGEPSVAPHTAATPTAQGKVTVGHVLQEGNWFSGRVYRPFLVPGLLSDAQAINLRNGVLLPSIAGADQLLRPLMDGQLVGNLETAKQGPGGIYVKGWVIDGDTQSPANVHVYVDGAGFNLGAANAERSDIAAQYPWFGANHGLAKTAAYAGSNGTKTVCVYGINVAGSGGNVQLACPQVAFSNDPFGAFDLATYSAGSLTVRGWSIDPNTDTSSSVQIRVDGTLIGTTTANTTRNDVAAAYPPYSSTHGFSTVLSATLTAGSHSVCATSVNVSGTPGVNTQISCRTVTV